MIGGLPYETKESSRNDEPVTEVGFDAKVASLKRRNSQRQVSWDDIRRATPASLFSELIKHLREIGAIQELDAFDKDIWSQLAVGEFVDLSAMVELSAIEQTLDTMRNLKGFLAVMSPGMMSDDSTAQIIRYVEMLRRGRSQSTSK
jgi:hypothetical protein